MTWISPPAAVLGWLIMGCAFVFMCYGPAFRWGASFVVASLLLLPALRSINARAQQDRDAVSERERRDQELKAREQAQKAAERATQLVASFPERRAQLQADVGHLERAVRAKDWTSAETLRRSLAASLTPLSGTELTSNQVVRQLQAKLKQAEQAIASHRSQAAAEQLMQQARARDEQNGYALQSILADYKNNEIAADARYKGRMVQVRGRVGDIKKEILGRTYVTLGTGADFEIPMVQCIFAVGKGQDTAVLSKRQEATLQGKVDGLMMNVLLSDCELITR